MVKKTEHADYKVKNTLSSVSFKTFSRHVKNTCILHDHKICMYSVYTYHSPSFFSIQLKSYYRNSSIPWLFHLTGLRDYSILDHMDMIFFTMSVQHSI